MPFILFQLSFFNIIKGLPPSDSLENASDAGGPSFSSDPLNLCCIPAYNLCRGPIIALFLILCLFCSGAEHPHVFICVWHFRFPMKTLEKP